MVKPIWAVAIAGQAQLQGRPVFFAFVPELLDHLRATFSPDSPIGYDELFEQIKTVPLLILDDLGAESSTAWAEEKLYQIVVHRHEARLPTVHNHLLQPRRPGNHQAAHRFPAGRQHGGGLAAGGSPQLSGPTPVLNAPEIIPVINPKE